MQGFRDLVEDASAICLCGSSPGPLADLLYPEFISEASTHGLPTLLDTYGEALRLGLDAGPTIVKVNLTEAEEALGRNLESFNQKLSALEELCLSGTQWTILTQGESGALFYDGDNVWAGYPPDICTVNHIGSGDAMSAGLIMGYLHKESPEDCFRFGMAAAVVNTKTWKACGLKRSDVVSILDEIEIKLLE